MKQIICDRCGKVIDYLQGMPLFTITYTNKSKIMDMCKECRIDLVNFMRGGRVVDSDYFEKVEAENEDSN